MVLAAYFVHTPVGSNATRLSLLFAIPLIVALVEFRPVITLATIVVGVVVQVPFTFGTLTAAGSPATHASYYRPLLAEIASRGEITGRVEIPELIGHWDSYFVARDVPLARGWLRQVDTELNGPALYDHAPDRRRPTEASSTTTRSSTSPSPTPGCRRSGGAKRARSRASPISRRSGEVRTGRCTPSTSPTPIVAAPGKLIGYTADSITVDVPAGASTSNVRWSDWLNAERQQRVHCPRRESPCVAGETGRPVHDRLDADRPGRHC